ncbi:LysM peptidoglycan-binding domain-containing M23 family metallopeptidase [Bradyrhizobium erythrophlei]|jgi:murein DD-endopeptidase MepM/ murein hydrolase activator NlpD|uniref:Murein DD-endopeptidase MepM and murein hydrolase activator NlpD, contain LysM domain n=1 Tax=Bradyrhizobium erythrophlei TaxID=1437360 RepID=A0A1M7UTG8_9BRAD|nr:LysM peptidoglycan-binding domain-containing M23 family metallopeptidase [Bradyrhizobium erythrophlei]SHN86217.1 Murein DD-endopeptidase MepM and murein hydrolase activator NlpD, contain LysM domain [Bradyrhizobium erythrophlei]
MSRAVALLCSRRAPLMAALALMSIGFAGCSADMQSRLSENPFASNESTASVPPASAERRELPQYSRPQAQVQSQNLPPPISAPQSYPASSGVSGGGRGLASYAPPSRPIETTGSVPHSVAAVHPVQGTKIIVGTSDTLEILARRYNVTPAAILQANGYKGPRALSPGQQLIIPRPGAVAAAPAPAMSAPASKPALASAAPSVHVVNHGDTMMGIARRNHISVGELARANGLPPTAQLKIGMKLNVPVKSSAVAAPVTQPAVAQAAPISAAPVTKLAAVTADPQQKVRLAQTTNVDEAPAAEAPVKSADATGALPTFRWPVRGKVITSYGAKTNGKSNDGINLAVPEGTPVKAAEDGVVAYSGNELKGYGNLVLVRHSNGYVTAYAHASELLVKRGDSIKRGQVIAKSGQSGEVSSPQLHFEIRKGSNPVDPLQFLNGA